VTVARHHPERTNKWRSADIHRERWRGIQNALPCRCPCSLIPMSVPLETQARIDSQALAVASPGISGVGWAQEESEGDRERPDSCGRTV